ncbi:hypothetical protein BK649_19155 [Pseudomonas canadensis]|uniref:Uncharacterized protein n=1 Tax=Pseudomonas canadensis TaxID=915099 RepID=A0A423F3R2_9PSED|nr:hypothetical protein BK649_19155 [Pseudomonas canadensis]
MFSLKLKQAGAFPDASDGAQRQVLLWMGHWNGVRAIAMSKNMMTFRDPIQHRTCLLQFLDQ